MADELTTPAAAEPQTTPAPEPLVTAPPAAQSAPSAVAAVPTPDVHLPEADMHADAAVDAFLNEAKEPPKPSMQTSVALAVGTNPDAEAEARRVSARTGVPIETVFAKPDEMKRKDALNDIDFASYEKLYPASALALSDVEFAKIAHDDTENMGYTENVLRGIGSRAVNLSGGLLRVAGTVSMDLSRKLDDSIPTVFDFSKDNFGPRHMTDEERARTTPFPETIGSMQKLDLGFRPRTTWEDVKERPLAEFLPFALEQGLVSAPDMAAAIFAPEAYFTSLTGDIGQNRAQNDERKDATVGDFIKSAPAAAATVLLERFATEGIFGAHDALKAFSEIPKAAAIAAAKEGTTEALQNAAQYASETVGTKKGFKWSEAGDQALQGFVAGAPFGGAVRGVTGGVQIATERAQNKTREATVAEQNARDFEHLNALASESKLRERDPLAFQNFIEQVTQSDGAIENVYVDPRALAQSGISLEALAEVSPSIADQVRVALETGSDVKIPVSEYASHLAGTELGQSMVDHLKTNPLGMSRIEAKEYMQGQGEQLRTDIEKTLSEANVDDAFQKSADVVRGDLLGKLSSARRFTDDVNTQYATLLSNFYKVQAARLGVTPEAFYAAHPVDIKSTFDVGNTLSLNQDAPGTQISDDGKGRVAISRDGKAVGELTYTEEKGMVRVKRADVETPGEGVGTEAYKQFIDAQLAQGKTVGSDADVSKPAQRIYEKLAEQGYTVTKNENTRLLPNYRETTVSREEAKWQQSEWPTVMTDGVRHWKPGSNNLKGEPVYTVTKGPELQQENMTARGSYNPKTNVITLLRNADLSTFLHESGHFFLETMNKIALDENAPEAIKQDMQATFNWLGVKDLAEWNSHDLEWQRDKHEQFARGFEAYLFEGKSPSIEMRGVFQRFRAWLLNVYQQLSTLNVNLSDEVRNVFDRMLATNDQIKETELARSYEPLFKDATAAGMNPAEWQEYQELGLQATQNATTELEARSMRDMKWLANAKSRVLKDLQREAAGRRREVRDQITKEVMSEPVNQARDFITRGKFELPENANAEMRRLAVETGLGSTKLSLPALKEMYGEGANAVWHHLSTGKYGEAGTEGLHPDTVAEMFGYSSGDQLVREMIAAENAKEKIAALTDQRMLEKYGDLTNPAVMAQAADEAVHNEARTRFVATEMNALQRATGGRKILVEAAKRFAEGMIDRLRIRDIQPSRYAAAEGRAARAADKAVRSGNLSDAAVEKRNQLIQNYAARAAHAGLAEADKAVRYFKKFDREGTRDNVDVDYLGQIDSLLERFDLRKSTTLKSLERRKSLLEWKASQEELGIEPEIPPDLLNEATRKSYKDMTLEEVRGLRDTIKQIEHLGRLKERLLTAKDNRDFKTTVAGLVASINEHSGGRIVDNRTRANKRGELERLFKGFVASHRKVASLVREMDGIKDGGPMWETFIRTMNDAGDKEASMREKATKDLAKLVKPVLDEGGKMGGKGQYFESIGKSLNREERIGMALNVGNLGNMQRLLDGEGWTMEQVRPVLDSLSKADWNFVQNVWGFFESFRPDIGAKEKRVYGKEPNWIEPNPVQTPYGELRGGYYPIKYDTRRNIGAEQHSDAEFAKQQMKGAYVSATTRRSFTKTRADEVKGRPLLYAMDGLYNGVNEIIHDLSWHEWLIDANRLLKNKSLDSAIRNGYGAETTRQFKDSVRDIAGGEMPTGTSFEKAIGDLRSGAVVAGLGLNIVNTVINLSGITNSIVRVGPRWVAQGLGKFTSDPRGTTAEVHEKSEFMRLRSKTMLREINEIQSQVRGKSQARSVMDEMMFAPLTMTQMAVDVPTWWGAYQRFVTEGNDEKRAIALADQVVLDSQSGGQVKDLAGIQRGTATQKLFTTFYGYFNSVYNLSVEQAKATNFKDPASVLKLGGDYLMLYTVPAVIGGLLKTALTGGKDDWDIEKLAPMLVNENISYLMGSMVGLREVTGAVQTLAGVNPYTSSYGGPAGLRFFQEFYNLATQIHQGQADKALRKSVINMLGILFRLPAAQINRTIDGISALIDGETDNPAAIIAGAPKKK